jgi:tetratricopeptide (TPR) repeat protein
MKKFILGFAIGCGMVLYSTNEILKEDIRNKKQEDEFMSTIWINELIKNLNDANSDDLKYKNFEALAIVDNRYKSYVDLKKVINEFREGQEILSKAVELQSSLTPDGLNMEKFHPLVNKRIEEAMGFFEKSKIKSDQLDELAMDNEYNFVLNYTKGEIYYRYLQFFGSPETALELFNQTVTYYRNALTYKPRDIDTVVNIEILIKEKSKLLSQAANPGDRKQQILSPKFGRGKNKGN